MADGALRILSIGLLALLYLFFLRALRAVWVETRAAERRATEAAPPADRRAPVGATARRAARPAAVTAPGPALIVIEPAEQRGRRHDVGDELTIGRAPGCQIRLEDDYVSQLHARLFRSGDQLMIEDLGSTNGTFAGRDRVSAPRLVRNGEVVRVGSFAFEVEA
ncbi:MAG: FHA domain-containing protein [Actinomycetota bacterium]